MKNRIKQYLKNILKFTEPYYYQITSVNRGEFDSLYNKWAIITGHKDSIWKRDRFFNLYQLMQTVPNDLAIDLGLFRGFSTGIIAGRFTKVYAIDSFEGLSEPENADGETGLKKGGFATPIDIVRNNLKEFDNITYIKGWIPEILKTLPEKHWNFVHVDVDLIDPTLGALDYFIDRADLIVCDDYSSLAWPNLKPAVDKWIKDKKVKHFALSSCQFVIMR